MDLRRSPLFNGVLYALALVGCIVAQWKELHALEYVCKPLLMLLLSCWFFFNSRRMGDRFTLLVQGGLFFSLIGDIAMMFAHLDQFNFLLGIAAFLLAQLCYTLAFIHNIVTVGGNDGVLWSTVISAALLIFGFTFALQLQHRVDEALLLPVMVYAGAITVMGMAAAFRFRRTFPTSFWMVLAGALLFILSDSLLATNRFISPFPYANTIIILTYAIAQVLIAGGALMHVLDPESIRRKEALIT